MEGVFSPATILPMKQFNTDFEIVIKSFAQGKFGKVHKAIIKNPSFFRGRIAASPKFENQDDQIPEFVAVKEFSPPQGAGPLRDYELEKIHFEADVLCSLESPLIVKGYALYESPENNEFYLVMEFLDKGTLYDAVRNFETFNEYDVVKIISALAQALSFCHSKGLYHRDIKPANILFRGLGPKQEQLKAEPRRRSGMINRPHNVMDARPSTLRDLQQRFQIVLADFGVAIPKAIDNRNVGSLQYKAPEIVKAIGQANYSKADLWSLGCVAFNLLSGGHDLFPDDKPEVVTESIKNYRANFNPVQSRPEIRHISEEGKQMLSMLLREDPTLRYSAQQLLQDPWMIVFQLDKKRPRVEIDRRKMINDKKPDDTKDSVRTSRLNRFCCLA